MQLNLDYSALVHVFVGRFVYLLNYLLLLLKSDLDFYTNMLKAIHLNQLLQAASFYTLNNVSLLQAASFYTLYDVSLLEAASLYTLNDESFLWAASIYTLNDESLLKIMGFQV